MTTKNALELEPAALWGPFLDLSRIPRGSGNEAAAAKWFAERAKAAGCEVLTDKVGNVLARKKAAKGREKAIPVILQCHIDMVCEKNEGTAHDFTKDPIQVWKDGDLLRARGTTLGADNGIGVAAALAVLASKDIAHGPLEVLVTIDEETGLTGANGLQPGVLTSKFLVNLDSEEEGYLTIGCAGGEDTIVTRKLTRTPAPAGTKAFRLKVFGLKGGHSRHRHRRRAAATPCGCWRRCSTPRATGASGGAGHASRAATSATPSPARPRPSWWCRPPRRSRAARARGRSRDGLAGRLRRVRPGPHHLGRAEATAER